MSSIIQENVVTVQFAKMVVTITPHTRNILPEFKLSPKHLFTIPMTNVPAYATILVISLDTTVDGVQSVKLVAVTTLHNETFSIYCKISET
jgi:hypothetical protein